MDEIDALQKERVWFETWSEIRSGRFARRLLKVQPLSRLKSQAIGGVEMYVTDTQESFEIGRHK
jgi:hypothetical protein